MNKINQGTILSLILLAGCASTEVKKDQNKITSLNDAQLKTLLVGKTMLYRSGIHDVTIAINPDGTTIGSVASEADKGTYTIKNGLYCSKWIWWGKGKKRCWSINKRANDYYTKSVSGGGNSFKFTVK